MTSYLYDVWGRTAGTKTSGDADWSCVTFDARGRAVKAVTAAFNGQPSSTATTAYSADGLTTAVADGAVPGSPNGSMTTTTTDLLGRAVKYVDVWGTTTTTSYDQAGRVTSSLAVTADGVQHTTGQSYDVDSKVTQFTVDGKVVAVPTYQQGEVTSVAYPAGAGNSGNGTSVTVTKDGAGALTDWRGRSRTGSRSSPIRWSGRSRVTSCRTPPCSGRRRTCRRTRTTRPGGSWPRLSRGTG